MTLCTNSPLDYYASDTDALGCTLFFLGVSQHILGRHEDAYEALCRCSETSWAASFVYRQSLCYFVKGKVHQSKAHHSDAIEMFSRAIELTPDNAYAIFRRAWSHKVIAVRRCFTTVYYLFMLLSFG